MRALKTMGQGKNASTMLPFPQETLQSQKPLKTHQNQPQNVQDQSPKVASKSKAVNWKRPQDTNKSARISLKKTLLSPCSKSEFPSLDFQRSPFSRTLMTNNRHRRKDPLPRSPPSITSMLPTQSHHTAAPEHGSGENKGSPKCYASHKPSYIVNVKGLIESILLFNNYRMREAGICISFSGIGVVYLVFVISDLAQFYHFKL